MKALLVIVALLAVVVPSAGAMVSINLHTANQGISSMSWYMSGTDIYILENWGSNDRGFLEISGLDNMTSYTVHLSMVNNTGTDWDRFSHEILDPSGDYNDFTSDFRKQPTWIPDGYSMSNNSDNLSFAQGIDIPRTSTSFANMLVSEDFMHDYIEFFGGTVTGFGGVDTTSFGIRNDDFGAGTFLLAQTPNFQDNSIIIPEPAAVWLFGVGLIGVMAYRRSRQ